MTKNAQRKTILGLPILTSLVVGNMIGTGIYLLPASLASYGTISILSWIYTSIGALLLALTYAGLNKIFPKTGGAYVYSREAFGELGGFLVAFTYWTSNLASIAGIAVASVGYLGFLIGALNTSDPTYSKELVLCLELLFVWVFTFINILGLHTAGVVQVILTILKMLPLLLISLVGLSFIHPTYLHAFNLTSQSNITAMSSAATMTFWAYIGLESATVPADNASSKAIYIATVFGTLLTSLIYILSTIVIMGMIPVAALKTSQFPFAQAATVLFGEKSATWVAICAVISGLGALNVCILTQGQLMYAAARDGLFPTRFAILAGRGEAPVAGHIFSSIIISLFLFLTMQPSLLKQFDYIILLAAFLTLLTYLMTTLASLKTQMALKMPWKQLCVPALAALYAIWMITSLEANIIWTGIILLVCWIPVYFILPKKRAPAET